MAGKTIKQSTVLDCTPKEGYDAWLDSKTHGDMVEGDAKIDPKVGGKFSVWGKTVHGKTLELDPRKFRIVQEWRYEFDDWPENTPSKITVEFATHGKNQTKLNFFQTDVPGNHAEEIGEGWEDYYWKPMKKYFADKK